MGTATGSKTKRGTGFKGIIGPNGRLMTPRTRALPLEAHREEMPTGRELLAVVGLLMAILMEELAAVVDLPILPEEAVEAAAGMEAIPIPALALPVLRTPPR